MPTTADPSQLLRWRLILGKDSQAPLDAMGSCTLSGAESEIDAALAAIYDDVPEDGGGTSRSASLGGSAPRLAKWLGDIRTYFKEDVVSVIQTDAIERRGLKQLLFEPETLKSVQPNIALVGTLMSLAGRIPERTKETARMVVSAVVEEVKKKLEQRLRQAVLGALNRKEHQAPSYRAHTGRVPALQHGDFWLAESSAICEYLAEAFPAPTHPRIFPACSSSAPSAAKFRPGSART